MSHNTRGSQPGRAAAGYTTAALAPVGTSVTAPAREAVWADFVSQVLTAIPELDPERDSGEIERRAKLLQRAHMASLSAKATKVRRLKAELRRAEAALAAAADGIPADDVA